MKVQSYVVKNEVLSDSELDLLGNISGTFNPEASFAIKISDIKNCLDVTKELEGKECMDCAGRISTSDYSSDIKFMVKLISEASDCDYVIVEFDLNEFLKYEED